MPAGLLIAGATGLVGRELVRHAASDPRWSPVMALVRRPWDAPGGVRTLTVDFRQLEELPEAASACCALGTTRAVAGSREAFRAVDFDAVVSFARAARAAGVRRMALVSALGAKAGSSNFYSHVKGEAEAALADMGFDSLVIVRPSLLAGDRASLQQPPRLAERLTLAAVRPFASMVPSVWRPIEAATVARAMLRALAEAEPGVRRLTSADLQRLGSPA